MVRMKFHWRKRLGGMIGSAARRSAKTNSTANTTVDPIRPEVVGARQHEREPARGVAEQHAVESTAVGDPAEEQRRGRARSLDSDTDRRSEVRRQFRLVSAREGVDEHREPETVDLAEELGESGVADRDSSHVRRHLDAAESEFSDDAKFLGCGFRVLQGDHCECMDAIAAGSDDLGHRLVHVAGDVAAEARVNGGVQQWRHRGDDLLVHP